MTMLYLIEATSCPHVVLRLLGLFAQQGLLPERVEAHCSGGAMSIRIWQLGLAEHSAHVIAQKMASMVSVRSVYLIQESQAPGTDNPRSWIEAA